MMRTGIRLVVLGALCAAVLGGCGGGGDDQPSAKEVAQEYVDARNNGDAAKVCELYSEQLRERLGGANCVAFVKEQTSGLATQMTLLGVQQSDDHATATIRSTAGGDVGQATARLQIQLARQDGDWRITSLGGRPSD
jgi:ketosteroid isomerase-like protein